MRFIILGIDRDHQFFFGQAIFPGDQIPGEFNRLGFEIIAERKITEHFKKGVVAGGIADIVEIIVLATGPYTFLRGCGTAIGALFNAGKDILELHHTGIGEHQGRIIARHQGARVHNLMAMFSKIIQKCGPDFIHAAHAPSPLLVTGSLSTHLGQPPFLASSLDFPTSS